MISWVCLCTAADKFSADRVVHALGHASPDGQSFTAPSSPTGNEPATHFGFEAPVSPSSKASIVDMLAGNIPPGIDWSEHGLTEQEVQDLAGRLISSWGDETDPLFQSPDGGPAHYGNTLTDNNLQRVVVEEPA